jgi:probable F420-dependent oxidoreductase
MRIGYALGNIGPIGTAESIAKIAQRAESLGYHSLWTVERLLWPAEPQTPYPVTPDGRLPEEYKHVLDPLDSLSFAAGLTRKVTLGTSVLDMPFYNPIVLARRLTTIDVLSNGRLRVGLGLGWSQDEMEAAGSTLKERGAKADEFLAVLKAIWGPDPVEFKGRFYRVPKAYISQKPVQKPHPPIYLAAFAPPALKRLATMADGWNPVMIPAAGMTQMFDGIKQMAKDAGRDPAALQLIVRANVILSDKPLGTDRALFSGTFDQLKEDLTACRSIGAHEVFFDPTFTPGAQKLDRWLRLMEQIWKISSE